ncbi:MAG: hypothetical protein JRI55_37560 [Deltaproteobacteria bacterium]|jgi:hypothetical protein|nr:hypothetical protein [Deltaproteobacteria bacterium]
MKAHAALAITTLIFTACGGVHQDDPSIGSQSSALFTVTTVNGEPGTHCSDLLAGQHIEAGTVCYSVNGTSMDVTFSTSGGWQLEEAHAWIGCDAEGYPQARNGNPKIGNFPYNSGDITGQTTYSFSVDLSSLDCLASVNCTDGNILFSMAHAALRLVDGSGNVIQTETGWADGDPSGGKSWATRANITLMDDSCGGGGGGDKCYQDETAFGYDAPSATCFSELGSLVTNPSRWGWSNGIYGPGTYSFKVYAGAGSGGSADCVITNSDGSQRATDVGTATLVYDGSSATVTYNLTDGWFLETTHVYVGCDQLASTKQEGFTLAPGQYGSENKFDLTAKSTSSTHTINGLSCANGIYAVIHAAVLKEIACQ